MTFQEVKKRIFHITGELLSVTRSLGSLDDSEETSFDEWNRDAVRIQQEIESGILKVAVVGAIKSGKSTVVNDLLGREYLKRGAGVVTSIVTRVRAGRVKMAYLSMKSWDDVNDDMRQALLFFPFESGDVRADAFDIRREKDRKRLRGALEIIDGEKRVTEGTLNSNALLLDSYLAGYVRMQRMVSADHRTKTLSGSDFERYKDFVGEDALAVYLRDVEVRVPPGDVLDDAMEIADCQGSDSPNPLHLTMIQDYLLGANLIVYVISSRTGIRQADVRFLDMIRRMGLLGTMLFIVNCDMSEHDSLEELKSLVHKTEESINALRPDSEVFSYSALFHLLDELDKDHLSKKELLKKEQWKCDEAMVSDSLHERKRFRHSLAAVLGRDRLNLMLRNRLERLDIALAGIREWIDLRHALLQENAEEGQRIVQKIVISRAQMKDVTAMVKDTLSGALDKSRRTLERDIDSFLDKSFGEIAGDIVSFLDDYRINQEKCERMLETSGFAATLYALFQDFKAGLDGYLAETINPRLVRFIRDEERKIVEALEKIAHSFNTLILDAQERYNEALMTLDMTLPAAGFPVMTEIVDMERIKRTAGLSLPSLVSAMRYTARIKTEAVIRLGAYRTVALVKQALKKENDFKTAGQIKAAKKSFQKIKVEMQQKILFNLNDYRENLKFQYLYKLNVVAINHLAEILDDRFRLFDMDMSQLSKLLDKEKDVKEASVKVLEAAGERLAAAEEVLRSMKRELYESQ